ncbi:MAG: S9 family peptidase, partial [Myxococcota bacterium]
MSKAPQAPQKPRSHRQHDIERPDPYGWLRADNWQEVMKDPSVLDPEIRAYLEAENAYVKERLKTTEDLQTTLFEEYRSRIKEDDSSVPAPDGDWSYYSKDETGGQHPIFCRRPRPDPDDRAEQVLLHGDRMAEGLSYFRIGGADHSHNHRILAYAVDTNGSERYEIRFKDLDSGELLDDAIAETSGDFTWARDNRTIFYTVLDDNHRPLKVLRHTLGTAIKDDIVVYEEQDAGFFVGVDQTESRAFILINTHSHVTSECWMIPSDAPDTPPRLVAARENEVEYDVSHHGDRLLIRTNRDGAEDYKIVTAPLDATAASNWRDLVPHESGRMII